MEADLRSYIAAQSDITAVIGSSPMRMYLLNAPQGVARPLIVYRLVGAEAFHHLRDYTGNTRDVIEFDIQSHTDTGAKTLKELVRRKLDSYRGTMGSTYVNRVYLSDESDDYTPAQNASEKGIYHALLEFEIWHTETAPSV